MKNLILLTLITLTLFSCGVSKQLNCGNTPKTFTETSVVQDGLTYETAIIIQEKDEMSGIGAEYAWLKEYYPNYRLNMQSLVYHNNKPYDVMNITTGDRAFPVFFDISNFFGKY